MAYPVYAKNCYLKKEDAILAVCGALDKSYSEARDIVDTFFIFDYLRPVITYKEYKFRYKGVMPDLYREHREKRL